jgi:hypothetical protein
LPDSRDGDARNAAASGPSTSSSGASIRAESVHAELQGLWFQISIIFLVMARVRVPTAQSILDPAGVPLDAIDESTELLELHFRGGKDLPASLPFFWMLAFEKPSENLSTISQTVTGISNSLPLALR